MRLWYDLHLHSCLSPCGDLDMTPYNLVNMAKLLGYDVIALTDHNTVGNCASAMEAGREADLMVLPGMELCTAEEIHVVFLFPALPQAVRFGEYVRTTLPPVKNKPQIYGEQLLMDAGDRVIGEEEILLVTASGISIEETRLLASEYGGICFPAHINRASYSVLSVLGTIPEEWGLSCAEITLDADRDALCAQHPILDTLRILRSSDSHYLENMQEPRWALRPDTHTPEAVLALLA